MSRAPFFSIITVCKNAGIDLAKTIESLRGQTYTDYEYIVIDGNSDDLVTPEVINSNNDFISKLVIEPDNGIYDAMNKGIKLSRGEYLYFLNAGDLFYSDDTLMKVFVELKRQKSDIIYGDVMVVCKDPADNYLVRFDQVDMVNLLRRPITHQCIFASRRVFERNGPFDTAFKIRGDHDWELRNYRDKLVTFRYLPIVVSFFERDGFTSRNKQKYGAFERKLFWKKNISWIGLWAYRFFSMFGLVDRSPFVRHLLNRII